MKIFVLLLTSLLFIFVLPGCKEAADSTLFAASGEILDDWVTLTQLTLVNGDETGEVLIGATLAIYISNPDPLEYSIEADYTLGYEIGGDPPSLGLDDHNWIGIVTPDPTLSAYCSITVGNLQSWDGGYAAPDVGDVLSFSYNMTSPDTATFHFNGDAVNVERNSGSDT